MNKNYTIESNNLNNKAKQEINNELNKPLNLTGYSEDILSKVDQQVNDISDKVKQFLTLKQQNNKDMVQKISYLTKELHNVRNFVNRYTPQGTNDDNESAEEFGNYIRKGSNVHLTTKSLHNSADNGEALVTPTLYYRIINEINSKCVMRQLASIETISTGSLDVIIEDGSFNSGWSGDSDNREETSTPKLKSRRIFVHELYAQPKASQALIDDAAIKVDNWLADRLVNYFLKAENEAFVTGDGNKKPFGVLNTEHNHVEVMNFSQNISVEMLIDMMNNLEEEYLTNATFLLHRTVLASIQKLKDNTGRFIWQPSLSNTMQQTIFGIPVICCNSMPAINNKPVIALGDFKAAYKIVDRADINIMRDPYTEKPFVKFYAVKRVGGDVVNSKALKLATFNPAAEDSEKKDNQ